MGRSLALTVALVLGMISPALADRAFTARFSTNASGDIAIVGNTLETCPVSAADCVNARAGIGSTLNNNSFTMERVDVDRTGLDSSSARLTLPAGARVLFAGLYYGARTTAGTGGKAAPDASPAGLRRVDLKVPGSAVFERLSSQVDQSTDVTGAYAAFVDITSQVQRAGSGGYTVAGVQAATGMDRYAGWALVVAYEAAGDPPRNLTVFDGLQSVTQGKPALTIPVSGFQTPLSGPVRTKLGFVAYEGDRGLTGDSATLDGKPLSDPLNPANNLFNSVISTDGHTFTDKTPDYVNQLGVDAKVLRIDGVLANGATGATIALKTSSDQYLPHVITFATDLYAPVIRATKSVVNLTHPNGPTSPGDRLRYTVAYTNEGLEAARNFVAVDQLPSDTTYQPGSLRISGAPAALTTPTDLAGDDLGEFDAAAHAVRFFLGSGASAGQGGQIAVAGQPGDRAEISFEVRVDPSLATEREIRNVAVATFVAPTLGKELTALSSEANILATPRPMASEPADLALAQSETVAPAALGNDEVDDHVTIDNHGPGDATDVVLHDVLPADAVVESATVDNGSCTVSANDVTCDVPKLDSGGSAEVNVVFTEPEGEAASGSLAEATVTETQFDPTPANASDSAMAATPATPGSGAPVIDLAVHDQESASVVSLGQTVTETITVVNSGPDTATGVDVTDGLSAAAEVTALDAPGATCASTVPLHCTFPSIAPGSSRVIKMIVRPLRAGRLTDAADVSTDQAEAVYADNVSRVSATIGRRRTTGRVRIVPVQPVTKAGAVVGFVITAAVSTRQPGVMPTVCLTLPPHLRLVAAPGAIVDRSRVCWNRTDLIPGRPQSFVLRARVGPLPPAGATIGLAARLTGANFTARRAATSVQVPPRHLVACASSLTFHPTATIAC
jgi:uncharacterized repeat protein (TIGR01451 family)